MLKKIDVPSYEVSLNEQKTLQRSSAFRLLNFSTRFARLGYWSSSSWHLFRDTLRDTKLESSRISDGIDQRKKNKRGLDKLILKG